MSKNFSSLKSHLSFRLKADGVIRSGKAYTAFGTEYDYYPIEKVSFILS